MLLRRIFFGLVLGILALPVTASAVELVMVERQGCTYCVEWKRVIGPIYPKTSVGQFAPLRMVDIKDDLPEGMTFARKVIFTPTFILIDEGREIGRLEGYASEDFFWGLLEKMLAEKTAFRAGS